MSVNRCRWRIDQFPNGFFSKTKPPMPFLIFILSRAIEFSLIPFCIMTYMIHLVYLSPTRQVPSCHNDATHQNSQFMGNRYGWRSFVNGRIKLSRESAITKSIVSKAEVTTRLVCLASEGKRNFPWLRLSPLGFTSAPVCKTKRPETFFENLTVISPAQWTLPPCRAMVPIRLNNLPVPARIDVKLDFRARFPSFLSLPFYPYVVSVYVHGKTTNSVEFRRNLEVYFRRKMSSNKIRHTHIHT